jgi:ABC-type transporter Mla subunit MlaD
MKTLQTARFLALWICALPLLASCSSDLNLTVLYGQTHGIKPDDTVRMHTQQIGTVSAVDIDPQGRVAVRLRIRSAYRDQITDTCQFVASQEEPDRDRSVIEVHCRAQRGAALANGAEVEGSTALDLLMELGRRSLRNWTDRFEAEMDRWQQALEQLPVEAWAKQLEDRLDDWARELERAGEETRRYFKQEVLPKLEETLQALRRHLSGQERRKDLERLQRKFDGLKRI